MVAEILVSLGRVVYVNFGINAGKTAVITDIIDGKRVIIAGPHNGIVRQAISNKRISLTRFLIPDVLPSTNGAQLK
jgi:large subunit ribosomal protein L14e